MQSTDAARQLLERLAAAPTPLCQVRAAAERNAARVALRYWRRVPDNCPTETTFLEVLRAAEGLASAFVEAGITERDGIAILTPAMPEGVIAFLAAMEVGVAFPLNGLLSGEAMAAQLKLANTRALVVAPEGMDMSARLRNALAAASDIRLVVTIGSDGADFCEGQTVVGWGQATGAAPRALPASDPERTAALFHTGGTTGDPKLAELSGRNVAAGALMSAAAIGFSDADSLLLGLPLFHVGGAITSALAALIAGASVTFCTPAGARNPAVVNGVWKILERTRSSILVMVPTSLSAIEPVPVGSADLGALRAVMTGAAPLSPDLSRRLAEKLGKPVVQVYGMTELSGICAAQPADGVHRPFAVGFTAPGLELSVVDGEVRMRGPNAFKGYRTAHGLVGAPEGGEVASGDLGTVGADGQLRLTGRRKDVIIRSGHNIDPLAIEDAALSHPSVAQAAAVGMPDGYAGEVPVLYIAARPGRALEPEEVAAWVAERIAEPPARPRRVLVANAIPMTAVGKLARFKLRQLAVETVLRERLGPTALVSCVDPAAKAVRLGWMAPPDQISEQSALDVLAELGLRRDE